MTGMTHLPDRALIAVSGPDDRKFLQGLITNDIDTLSPSRPIYAALLTPQGKILFDFLIFEQDGHILLDVNASQREPLLKRLTMYRLRAKVDLTPRDDLSVVVRLDTPGTDPRHPELGTRNIVPRTTGDGSDAYRSRRLSLGIPEGEDFGHDRMFALEAGLEDLHGVSFTKGCYVGQELTARMKHRSTARKRLLPVLSRNGVPLPAAGARVVFGEKDIGELIAVYGEHGFALTRLDRLEESGDVPVDAGGVAIRIVQPSWLS